MCLLIAAFGVVPEAPLVLGANRDEFLARPANAMEVLAPSGPRILGGRDLMAGGTWLAVSERGVVAGLTNRPSTAGRDSTKRSRGELPLGLAAHASAEEAARAFGREIDPDDYNGAWLLVGDRDALYYFDLAARPFAPVPLGRGVHILENKPLEGPSAKADLVRARLGAPDGRGAADWLAALEAVLASHEIPAAAMATDPAAFPPPQVSAACVHAGPYGTRSAEIVTVGAPGTRPSIRYADGPSCVTPWRDADGLWGAG